MHSARVPPWVLHSGHQDGKKPLEVMLAQIRAIRANRFPGKDGPGGVFFWKLEELKNAQSFSWGKKRVKKKANTYIYIHKCIYIYTYTYLDYVFRKCLNIDVYIHKTVDTYVKYIM